MTNPSRPLAFDPPTADTWSVNRPDWPRLAVFIGISCESKGDFPAHLHTRRYIQCIETSAHIQSQTRQLCRSTVRGQTTNTSRRLRTCPSSRTPSEWFRATVRLKLNTPNSGAQGFASKLSRKTRHTLSDENFCIKHELSDDRYSTD